MTNIQYEISRVPPRGAPERTFYDGTPILYAFGCALLEHHIGSGFTYTAANLESGRMEVMGRRPSPLTTSEAEKMAERMRRIKIAGAGRMEAERKYGQRMSHENCREILRTVFRRILPEHGYAIRKEQIALSENMLDTI